MTAMPEDLQKALETGFTDIGDKVVVLKTEYEALLRQNKRIEELENEISQKVSYHYYKYCFIFLFINHHAEWIYTAT